jgi:hypothetical protein
MADASAPVCARCGHAVTLHGKHGFGHCRHGWENRLALAVAAVRASVAAELPDCERDALVERAMEPRTRCDCTRFLRRPPKSKA